ncbi:MAG TPA: NERD domain-containing protein [Candidatus Tetragenococcus pullicola]|nr:NERD domain-containing protein [Candidatus Tetragenococcus pullicola]
MRIPSHEQQWLTALNERVPLLTDEAKQLKNLEEGFQGECYFDQLFHLFGPKEVPYLDDITLKHQNSVVQIDKLFLLNDTLYLIDTKAYHGIYRYDGRKWRGEKFSYNENIFYQLFRAQTVVENILEKKGLHVTTKSYLVFTEDDLSLAIPKEFSQNILQSHQLSEWIHALSKQPIKNSNEQWQARCIEELNLATIPRYRTWRTLSLPRATHLKKGICCENCHQYDLCSETYFFTCQNCGHRESKEKAYVRTICDCGTIFHDQELTIGLLRNFFGEILNEAYLQSVLRKHFLRTEKRGNASSYINFGTPIYEWFEKKKEYFGNTEKRVHWENRY